ncbi:MULTISPECIES: PhzF family isomerase [unclassified Pseudodesulfovibrio]|uniref:PhzF family isomerase n=1 Tax=unclassified Pseudodesulfovibrio TaxID=2661612 RepID=UPI000FEB83B8|nr:MULTISPECIES: PhzF family isomerase [unclassified Pseudodesulfovibrio]MCJ2165380.1 PhzF family isomerase [Pseudodesulfovibrio sp. S3-i]RWU02842.1 PhzF family isomerase [Pseudodesulfovibrio sp. S3]
MTKQITVALVDAFTTIPGKGNRAGVVLDATGLSAAEMQAIAKLVNVSETAFMIPAPESEDHELHVRYFTPATEVPICGHATIGAHYARAVSLGLGETTVVARIGTGTLPVDITSEDGRLKIVMTQGDVIFTPPYDQETSGRILSALGLSPLDTVPGLPLQEVSTGHSKVMVPIDSVEKLDTLSPDMTALAAMSQAVGCNGFFVFTLNSEFDSCLTSGRMFAPAIGIDEDPVTGNGNGPCGAYLARYGLLPNGPKTVYRGRQGVAMGKEGEMEITVHSDQGRPVRIQVAGTAVEAGTMNIETYSGESHEVIAREVETE